MIDHPVPVGVRVEVGPLERVATQVQICGTRSFTNGSAHSSICIGALHRQTELLVADPYRDDVAVIAEVNEARLAALLASPVR